MPLRETARHQKVRQVVFPAEVDRLTPRADVPVAHSEDRREGDIEEGHHQDQAGDHHRLHRIGGVLGEDQGRREEEAEEERAVVAEIHLRRREVVPEEPQRRSDQRDREVGEPRLRVGDRRTPGDQEDEATRDRGDPADHSVGVVEGVRGADHADDPDQSQTDVEPAAEGVGKEVHLHPEGAEGQGDSEEHAELHHGTDRSVIVEETEGRDDRGPGDQDQEGDERLHRLEAQRREERHREPEKDTESAEERNRPLLHFAIVSPRSIEHPKTVGERDQARHREIGDEPGENQDTEMGVGEERSHAKVCSASWTHSTQASPVQKSWSRIERFSIGSSPGGAYTGGVYSWK